MVPIDFYVESYKHPVTHEPTLDFRVNADGTLFSLFGSSAVEQRAIVAGFTQKGTVPQLPDVGVEWAELLTGSVLPSAINSEIITAIRSNADTLSYAPHYATVEDNLMVTIKEQGK